MRSRFPRTAGGVTAIAVTLMVGTPVAAQAPDEDSVAGRLFAESLGLIFTVDARGGPSGENPTGTVQWASGGGAGLGWSGTVTCLAVSEKTAVIGFSGTHDPRFEEPLHPVAGLIRVVDGGGVESGQDRFEWAEVLGPGGGAPIPGPTDCSSFPSSFPPSLFSPPGGAVNEFGDIVVTDTKAVPTRKDHCKNGGWRSYGVFKNQGDCVSYVATGGRNPPAASP
jgi:hypothetical protein